MEKGLRERALGAVERHAMGTRAMLLVNGSPAGVPRDVLELLGGACSAVVAVDSGLDVADEANLPVGVIVGDLDSVGSEVLAEYEWRGVVERVSAPEKDQTDLEMALDYALESGRACVVVTNFAGGRLDHELAALGSMGRAPLNVVAADGSCAIWFMQAQGPQPARLELARLGLLPGDEYSVIAYDGPATLTQRGVRYPQESVPMQGISGLGISNVVMEEGACVQVEQGRAILVVAF